MYIQECTKHNERDRKGEGGVRLFGRTSARMDARSRLVRAATRSDAAGEICLGMGAQEGGKAVQSIQATLCHTLYI